jgi:hypothetical protein
MNSLRETKCHVFLGATYYRRIVRLAENGDPFVGLLVLSAYSAAHAVHWQYRTRLWSWILIA